MALPPPIPQTFIFLKICINYLLSIELPRLIFVTEGIINLVIQKYNEGVVSLKVKDIMTKDVAYVQPGSTLTETAKLMQQHNVGSIPVCDQNKVVGMVTDRDIVVRSIAVDKNPSQTPVSDIMTTGVKTVTPDMDMHDVAKEMASSQIRRVPVIENNSLVGIVALGDVASDAKYYTEVADTLSDISQPLK